MKIFPAIDIKNGKCVRLLKGDFNQSTEYEKSPIEQVQGIRSAIEKWNSHFFLQA